MTQSRVSSVRQLAAGRFDWHATLAQISQVVPKNTSLATLTGLDTPSIGALEQNIFYVNQVMQFGKLLAVCIGGRSSNNRDGH